MFRTLRAMRAARLCPAGTKRRRPENVFAKENTLWPRMASLRRSFGWARHAAGVLQIDVLLCILSLKNFFPPAGNGALAERPKPFRPLQ